MTFFTLCTEIEEANIESVRHPIKGNVKALFYAGEGKPGLITVELNGLYDFEVGKEYIIEIRELEVKIIET